MRRTLAALTVLAALAGCGKLAPRTGLAGEPCTRNADCSEGLACNDGHCVADRFRACDAGTKRCNGGALEICRSTADGWNLVRCPGGCQDGACLAPPCSPGEKKCEGSLQYECLEDGSAWQFVTACASGCDTSGLDCAPPQCTPFQTRCKAGTNFVLEQCTPRGAWAESTCVIAEAEAVCDRGVCVPKVCPSTGPRLARCDGDIREVCTASGGAFDPAEICPFGCEETSATTAACKPAACTAGEEKCEGDALVRCAPDRRMFSFVQYCPAGCGDVGGRPGCLPTACSPLARRCALETGGTWVVEQCSAAGTAFAVAERCAQGCHEGSCVTQDSGCAAGDRRCSGREAEVCVRQADGTSSWRFEERCAGACQGGACDGAGACGCAGGVSASADACGSSARPATVVRVFGADGASLPADGLSTFLAYTDVIAATNGAPVPDGTLVTFSVDGADAPFLSPDADPAAPGLQRPSVGGRARAVLRAPAAAREVQVGAGLGGRCTATTALRFVAPSSGARTGWVAEDFTSARAYDRVASTAQWDVVNARARAVAGYRFGSGNDGAFTVPSGTKDLWDEALARAYPVVAIGAADATLDAYTNALSAGDEVLLLHVSGATALVGTWEFKRIAAVDGARLRFEEPVGKVFGAASNADLTGQRVVAQRVPNFTDVTVAAGATLTTRGYAATVGGGTGVLALRATGTVRIAGAVQLAEKGLPPSTTQAATSTAQISRLLPGGGVAKAGGGVVFVAAKTLSLRPEPSQPPSGTISASSTGGQGGTVWLQAGSLGIGSGLVTATGSGAGLNGRVRLDYGVAEAAQTSPDATLGQAGGFVVQTTASWIEPAGAALLRSATLLGLIGGAGPVQVGLPAQVPAVSVEVSADAGAAPAWVSASGGRASFPNGNKQFRWKARLDPITDLPIDLYGIAFKLEVN